MPPKELTSFKQGIKDGLPICVGYFSVAFAFGIFSVGHGLDVVQTLVISLTNVTSAGQLAAVPIMAAGGTLVEMAATQFIINLRYALMSVSLSQKLGKSVRFVDRFIIAFVNTDEVFAVASSKKETVGRRYMFGLILTPYVGWAAGTLLGACAGNMLPEIIISSLGIAIYGMFIAIVVPETKKSKATLFAVALAIVLSCIFNFVPVLSKIPSGFTVIICAGLASLIFAFLCPIDTKKETEQ
jgi:predicted branched-subunit amino acid permease